MVYMVPLLTDHIKRKLLAEILFVTANFSDENFKKLIEMVLPLDSANLELWFKDLAEQEVPLVHGILALIYYGRGNYILAAEEAVIVEKYFPETEMWNNLAMNAILEDALSKMENACSDSDFFANSPSCTA